MKKLNFVIVLVLFTNYFSVAQNTMTAFFENEVDVTFLGYDFTHARFIGSLGFNEPARIESSYLQGLNDLVIMEEKKFSLREPFQLNMGNYKADVDHSREINRSIDVASIITDGQYSFEEDELQGVISNYDFGDLNGIGILYFVESLNKLKAKANVYMVFIDLDSNTILHAEKVSGSAKGFGWRNYWAGAMYSIKKDIKRTYYERIYSQYVK